MTAAERIYEKYVKSLPDEERERLLELLKGDVESDGADITALEGLGASIWEDADTDEYVDSLRDEWNQD